MYAAIKLLTFQLRGSMDQLLRLPLAYLAVYVEQAKQDESRRGHHAVDDTIRQLEDTGIYRILCHLHRDYTLNQIPWEPTVPPKHTVMSHSCRKFTDRAPSDNRNFMVFYTLSKLLHNVAGELDRGLARGRTEQKRFSVRQNTFGIYKRQRTPYPRSYYPEPI